MDQNHFLIFTPTTSHIHPLTSFSCIFLTFFLLTGSTALAKVDSQFLACVPKTCGDGQNITYPFYIQDQQQPYCGYPGFEVSCNNKGKPVLKIPDNDNQYIIHHIFYKNQSLRVSNAGVWELNSSSSCHVVSSWQNLSLPLDRFELFGNKRDVFVLYNCNNQSLSERLVGKKVGCNSTDDDVNGVVLAVGEDDPDLGLARKECEDVVVAPVEGYGEDSMAMMTRLRSGFLMKWTASNCSSCEESGGRCGFDNSTYHFKCFCPDRPHACCCRDPGMFNSLFFF